MGKIDLQNPEITLGCFEECELKVSSILEGLQHGVRELMIRITICRIDSNDHDTARPMHEGAGDLREVFFGRLVRRGWTELSFFITQ